MAAVLPGRFGNRQLRPTKRRLSVYEKSSLPTTTGRALILPGDPNTEVEELVEAGFNPCHIFGVEEDEHRYQVLRDFYHDSANIFHGDIYAWMSQARARQQYSYLHFDFCGHLTREEAVGMQRWKDLAAPVARVRVSSFRGRRSPLQLDWEEQMQADLLLTWCQLGYDLDTVDPDRWVGYHAHLSEDSSRKDTTYIVIALQLLNFFFGIPDYRQYVDESYRKAPQLPTVEGSHRLTNINRWTYNEAGVPNHMFTVWADLQPLDEDPLRNSTQWTLNELSHVFESICYHAPTFNPNI